MSAAAEHAGSNSELLQAKPPASNPGSDDSTGGIAPGNGETSSVAHVGSPQSADATDATSSGNQTIATQVSELVSSLATKLGFGGASSAQNEGIEPHPTDSDKPIAQTAQDYAAAGTTAVAASIASAAALITGQSKQTDPATSSSSTENNTTTSDLINSTAESVKRSTTEPFSEPSTTDKITTDKMSDTTTDTTANPSTDGSVPNREVAAEAAENGQGKNLEPAGDPPASEKEGDKPSKSGGTRLENPDAIPTAGGERLGSKHEGESEVVPELPPVRDEEGAGIASADGQPTKQVEDNTAKNTGGATGGPGHDGVLGKVKGALHINK